MASMNSTVDGLGFEELGQPGSQISDLWVVGSITTQSHIYAAGNTSGAGTGQFASISGTTAVNSALGHFTTMSGGNIVEATTGKVRSIGVDNAATVYGYRIQAGSVLVGPTDHSGLITFKTDFTNEHWYMTLTPRTLTNPYRLAYADFSGAVPCVSGQRRASGCWVYAGSNTVLDWIAVGM